MNQHDATYLDLLCDILDNGVPSDDRTGVGTYRTFGQYQRYDLRETFPLLTTKKLIWASIVSELLWFIEGSGDERRLAEIRYGKPREELTNKTTIWSDNASAPYWVNRRNGSEDYFANGPDFEGDLGRVYGKQWRDWQSPRKGVPDGTQGLRLIEHTDQLTNLIEGIKKDPNGRRHLLTAWNPGELDQMALPPCHVVSQYSVINGELSSMLFQRSADYFLGSSYNIASYALLTLMIAHVCDLTPGDFVYTMGDCHLYKNHRDVAVEQLGREPFPAPRVKLNPEIKSLFDFKMSDIELIGYESHPTLKAPMAV